MWKTVTDVGIGLLGGYAGAKAMTPVTTKLSQLESEQDKQREKDVSPGVSYDVAAKRLAARAGIQLDERQTKQIGDYFHLGLGLTAGVVYMLLRRRGMRPLPAALLTSTGLFLGMDEGLTPAMGWSAPDPKYPLFTHVRGLLGHLMLGATIVAVAEPLRKLLGS